MCLAKANLVLWKANFGGGASEDIYLDKLCVTWHGQIFLAKKTKRIELVPFILQFPPIIFAFRPIIFVSFVKTPTSIGLTVVKHAKPSERNHKKKGTHEKTKSMPSGSIRKSTKFRTT